MQTILHLRLYYNKGKVPRQDYVGSIINSGLVRISNAHNCLLLLEFAQQWLFCPKIVKLSLRN